MMSTENGRRRNQLRATLIGLLVLPMVAAPGDWELTDSTTARVTAVDRTGTSEQSGLVFQLSPGIRLSGRGARASADVSYQLTGSVGTDSTDPLEITHNLLGRGEVEAIEDFFFLGANASARLIGDSAAFGNVDPINVNTEGRQSYSLQITPRLQKRLGRYATIVSDNAFDYVTYSGENDANNDGSSSSTLNLGVRSGPYYLPVDWALDATQTETDYKDRTDTRSTYTAKVGYRVTPRWRVSGTLGYEENDVFTVREETDGTIWFVGADWTPNPRTSVSGEYGERYLGDVYSLTAQHRTRRTLFSMDLSRDISNRRTLQLVDSFFIVVVDPSGNQFLVPILDVQEIDEDFVNTQLRAAVRVTGLRTTVTLTGTLANRDYEISETDEDTYGLALDVSRRLGASYDLGLGGSYTHGEGTASGDSNTYDLRVSLGRSLSPRTRASIDLLHRQRDASDDYTENRIGVSLTTSFL